MIRSFRRSFSWRRAGRAVFAGALVLFASSCFLEDLVGPNQFTIWGIVRDGRLRPGPQPPVAGIVVRLHSDPPRFATTDENGRFEFDGIERGQYFNVNVEPGQGAVHPSSHVGGVSETREIYELFFMILPGDGHRVEGSVTGVKGAYVCLCDLYSSFALLRDDGTFAFDGIPFQQNAIEILTSIEGGPTYTPASVVLRPFLDFEHAQAGTGQLGTMTVASVVSGATDVSGCFEVLFTGEGTGTIRQRTEAESAAGGCTAYGAIWSAGSNVDVTLLSDLGPSVITLDLWFFSVLTASSASFTLSERLVPSAPLTFTASAP